MLSGVQPIAANKHNYASEYSLGLLCLLAISNQPANGFNYLLINS